MMKRFIFAVFLFAVPLFGQAPVAVTATVTGSNSAPYIYGTYSVQLVDSGGNPLSVATIGPNSYTQTQQSGALSSAGALSLSLMPNSFFNQSSTKWRFAICSAGPLTQLFVHTGNAVCYSSQVTITSAGSYSSQVSMGAGAVYYVNYLTGVNYLSGGATGSVTSVALVGSANLFSATPGTAVTASGTLNIDTQLATQVAHCVISGPASGSAAAPTCRALIVGDLPAMAADTFLGNASGTSAAPTAVAMPTCTTGADLYNTSTHAWSCVSTGGGSTPETHIASSSAELDFTSCISSANANYQIIFTNIVYGSGQTGLVIQFSTNGGSTYDTTTANYTWNRQFYRLIDTSWLGGTAIAAGTDPGIGVFGTTTGTGGGVSNSSLPGLNGSFLLSNPLNASSPKIVTGTVSGQAAGNQYQMLEMGEYTPTSAVNAFRILGQAGNIASGQVTCQPLPQ